MNTQHAVPTQQDAVTGELKSERVQEELADAGEAAAIASIELAVYQPQTVTLELFASKVAITLHGNVAVSDPGGVGDAG